MANTAAIYTRISSDPSGQRAGVERQRADCEQLAARLGLDVVEVYTDNDVSAYSGKPRTDFERMLDDVQRRRFSTVIVWAVDRLYRRISDLERIVTVFDAASVDVATVKSGEIDLSTADGRLHARLLGSVAQHESEKKSERITAAARQRATVHHRTPASRVPFGWRQVLDADGRRSLMPDEVTGPALAAVYRDVADGMSVAAAHKRLGSTVDVGRMTSSTLATILKQPRHGGLASYKGEPTGPAADGLRIVDESLWRQVHAIVTDPARRTSPGRPANTLLGGGLLRCGKCGGPMAAGRKSGAPTYVCSRHAHLQRRRAPLDALVADRVAMVLDALGERDVLVADDGTDPGADVRARIAGLEATIAGLDAELRAGRLPVVDYTRVVAGLRAEVEQATAALQKVSRRPRTGHLLSGGDPAAAWADLVASDPAHARLVAAELLDSITATTERTVVCSWRSWLSGAPTTTTDVLPAVSVTKHRTALDEALGQPVPEVVKHLRDDGLSWRGIAREITARTGIAVTHAGCKKWGEAA